MTQYSPRQLRIIQQRLDDGKPLTGTITISLGIDYQADLLILLEDNPGLFNGNLSRLVRDMILAYKVEWREDKSSQLDEILKKLDGLRTVSGTVEIVETVEDDISEIRLDPSGGFSE